MSLAEQSRRQAETAGQGLHLFLHCSFRLAARVAKRGDEKVFQHLALFRLHQRRIDLDALHVHLRGHAHRDQAAAGDALDLDVAEFLLHRLHLGLQLLRLLHHAEKIDHRCLSLERMAQRSSPSEPSAGSSLPYSALILASGASGASLRTSTTFAPGKRDSTSCTRGSASAVRACSCFAAWLSERSVGWPCALDTTMVQRRLVHSSSLRGKSVIRVLAAFGSSAISSLPSSKRTRRTSPSSAALVMRSRFWPASATSWVKLVMRSAGAEPCGSGAGAAICGRALPPKEPEGELAGARTGAAEATGAVGALRTAPPLLTTGEPPPFCSSILIASSGVGRSAT